MPKVPDEENKKKKEKVERVSHHIPQYVGRWQAGVACYVSRQNTRRASCRSLDITGINRQNVIVRKKET